MIAQGLKNVDLSTGNCDLDQRLYYASANHRYPELLQLVEQLPLQTILDLVTRIETDLPGTEKLRVLDLASELSRGSLFPRRHGGIWNDDNPEYGPRLKVLAYFNLITRENTPRD